MLCLWWDWKGVLYYELLPESQTIHSNKYFSQLYQLKAALDKKHPELVNRKHVIFHQGNTGPCFFDDQAKTVTVWLGSSDSSTVFTIHRTFRFPLFQSSQNSLKWKKFQFSGKLKVTWNGSLLKKMRRWNCDIAWKMAGSSGTKWKICCSITFSVKMKNVSFFF